MKKFLLVIILAFVSVIVPKNTVYAKNENYGIKYLYNDKCLISSFSTEYKTSSAERKHNVSLAVNAVNNVFLDVGAEFSFNKIVGKRIEQRGYKLSKVIIDGKFQDGIGGGVCQVSTTLYNAVLMGGLKITERHKHTVAVNYVEPSFDAMVNFGVSDLKFINDGKAPVYITATADGEKITVNIFGKQPDYKIRLRSKVVAYKEIDYEIKGNVKGETERIVVEGKKGIVSIGYVDYYSKNKLIKSVKISQDEYKGIKGIIIRE